MNKLRIKTIVVRIVKFVFEVLLSWLLSLAIVVPLLLLNVPDRIGGYTEQELIDRVVGSVSVALNQKCLQSFGGLCKCPTQETGVMSA